MQQGIVAEKLSAGYGDTPVFQNLNLKILPGKITTLIGTNGSGKSTILKTLSRLLTPAEGTVCLDGDSIFRMSTRVVAQRLAVLPQGAQAPSGITVKDLVEYGRYPYRKRLSGLTSKDEEIIKWALDSTNMLDMAGREMDQLSGGQRQRAWIAMALAQKTGILFLDEPTTYLDISHQLEILQLLKQLNRRQGVTVVMVLHDLNHAIMFSDHLVAIKNGEKYLEGAPEQVITPQMLREVFDVEAEVIQHPVLNVPVCLPYGVRGQMFENHKEEKRL